VQYSGDQGTRYLQIGPSQMIADSDPGSAVFQGARNGNGTFVTAANVANTGTDVLNPGTVTNPAAVLAHNYQINFTSATTFDVVDTTTATTVLAAQTYVDGGAIAFNGIQVSISGAPATGDSFTIVPSTHQDVFATVQNIVTGLETYSPNAAGVAQLHNAMNQGMVNLDQAMGNLFDFRARAGARLNAIDSQKNSNDSLVLDAQQALSQVQDLDYAGAISRLNQQMLALQAAQQTFTKVQGLNLFNFLR
jgi:flagellar hook-associated protein 3 FlgL